MSDGRSNKQHRNVLIPCLALLALAILVVEVVLLLKLKEPRSDDPTISMEEPAANEKPTQQEKEILAEDVPELPEQIIVKPDESESQEEPELQEEPESSEADRIEIGSLWLNCDENQVEVIESGSVYIVQCKGSEDVGVKLFLQHVDGAFAMLTPENLDRIAIGLLQACCYSEPETNQVQIVSRDISDTEYRAELETDGITAAVRILNCSEGIWCGIVLTSESTEGRLLTDIMNQAEIR